MKKIILVTVFFNCMVAIQAQDIKHDAIQVSELKQNKNKQVSFQVNGTCGMCKKRIEERRIQ